jgi:SMC interacting uncharacterized protein involved in chromosome segregation
MSQPKRGYLNISLPVHREDTIYTYPEGMKHLQSKIAGLRRAVEERDVLVKEKDALVKEKDALVKEKDALVKEKSGVIQRLEKELMQKEGVVQKFKAVGPGVKMGLERVERIKRADRMMELMGVLSDREREAYDPL